VQERVGTLTVRKCHCKCEPRSPVPLAVVHGRSTCAAEDNDFWKISKRSRFHAEVVHDAAAVLNVGATFYMELHRWKGTTDEETWITSEGKNTSLIVLCSDSDQVRGARVYTLPNQHPLIDLDIRSEHGTHICSFLVTSTRKH
jgi:hypothetical protein